MEQFKNPRSNEINPDASLDYLLRCYSNATIIFVFSAILDPGIKPELFRKGDFSSDAILLRGNILNSSK